ncbi:MAG: HNH endonuclease domain-containing protein [Candidatus Aminicenantes bacterium]
MKSSIANNLVSSFGTDIELPKAFNLNISAFEQMLNINKLTNSYKLYWFSAIFDEVRKKEVEISFKKIVFLMVTKCWYSIVSYRLNLGYMDNLNDLVSYLYERYHLKMDISKDQLFYFLENLEDKEFEARVVDFFRYVPYRLISPFYPQIRGIDDHLKNKKIEELSMTSDDAIYRIDSRAKKIIVNQNWFDYIYQNQIIISGWYYYKLIYFLQKRNPSIPSIPFKLDAPYERSLNNARKFWAIILKKTSISDIYSSYPLVTSDFSIDHFIPWRFVLHDQLWNLIPTFKTINSEKKDQLPKIEVYLEKFCQLQYLALKIAMDINIEMRLLEDYFEINRDIMITRNLNRNAFIKNLKEHLIPLYQLAYNQGFPVWEYSSK